MNILAPEVGVLQIDTEKQNCDFHEKNKNDFAQISIIYGDHIPK
jgi:hypothetical protein